MNAETFSKSNHDLKQNSNDFKQNIVWFDGEVCIYVFNIEQYF